MKTISMMMMSLVVMALSLTSCSKSVDSPAGEFAQCLNDMASKVSSCKDYDDLAKLDEEGGAALSKFTDEQYANYELTQADKDCLKDAFKTFTKATLKAIGKITEQEIPESTVQQTISVLDNAVENSSTLGEVYQTAMRGI